MAKPDDAVASFERNIETQSGRSIADWVLLVQAQKLAKHGDMVGWLKSAHGLSHSHANHIAKRTMAESAPRSQEDPIAHLFEGGKEGLRPLYDQLEAAALRLGSDVEIAPKKANSSVRRRKQFALLQPSSRTRLDLGLILPKRPANGRLEVSGSFNAMFTHRVRIEKCEDIDDELLGWLREAYDGAL